MTVHRTVHGYLSNGNVFLRVSPQIVRLTIACEGFCRFQAGVGDGLGVYELSDCQSSEPIVRRCSHVRARGTKWRVRVHASWWTVSGLFTSF